MIYKKNTIFALIAIFAAIFVSCSDNMGSTDHRVAAVPSFFEPMDGKEITLQPAGELYFEWEYVNPNEAGVVTYQVAIDKADGDFSSPLYLFNAENNGLANSATLSHAELNKIARSAGINPSEKATLKWTVLSAKGTQSVQSPQAHKLLFTRLPGYGDDLPEVLYLTGEATEVGAKVESALKMRKNKRGEFEIYTRLTEGANFTLIDNNQGETTSYSLKDGSIRIGGTSEVPHTGIYKVFIDFNSGKYSLKEILSVNLYLNWSERNIALPYVGLGTWQLKGHLIEGLNGNDNSDDRYKFRMKSTEGETEWRSESNDSKPNGKPEYYYMVEKTDVTQWTDGEVWKNPAEDGWNGKTYDITFSLTSEAPYTHNLVIH